MLLQLFLIPALVLATLPILHLDDVGGQYYDFPIQLGSPPQQIYLRLDLIQGDVWVPDAAYFSACAATTTTTSSSSPTSSSSSTTTTSSNACASAGVYQSYGSLYSAYIDILLKLETGIVEATQYLQTFVNTVYVWGVWFTDSVNIEFQNGNSTDDVRFWDVPFVLANHSNVVVGGLALGISQYLGDADSNFISNFINNGLIESNSYSVALSANNSTDPQLILGGVIGDLIDDQGLCAQKFVPVYNEVSGYGMKSGIVDSIPAFPIYRWGVTSNTSGESLVFSNSYNDRMTISQYPKAAIIDSRHAYNYIPYSTLVEMAIELNAYYSSDLDIWITACDIGSVGTIDMYLTNNFTINMPISNFIFPIFINGTRLVFEGGEPACALSFLPDYYTGFSLMGTSFIKSVYLAVDNDDKQMAIGNLKNLLKDKNLEKRVLTYNNTTDNDKDVYIGDGNPTSQTVFTTSSSGRLVTVDGVVKTDDGIVFTESYAKPEGPNLITTTFDGTVFTITNNESTVMVTGATTLSSAKYSNVSGASSVTYTNYRPITNGNIPYATTYSSYSDITLTIPSVISFTDVLQTSSAVTISAGEVVLETGLNNVPLGASKSAAVRDTTIYAFSSLVTSVSRQSAAANSLSINWLGYLWWVLGLLAFI